MAEREKRKIRRNVYYFDVKKTISPTRRFAKKEEKITFDLLLRYIRNLFFGYVKKEEKAKVEAKITAKATPINAVIIGIVLIFLAAIFLPIIIVLLQPPSAVIEEKKVIAPPLIYYKFEDGGVVDSSDGLRFFIPISLNGSYDRAKVTFIAYRDNVPEEVFVLRSIRLASANYDDFYKNLKSYLRSKGITVSEITFDEIYRISNKSNTILIVPTGYLPEQFITGFNLTKFISNGNVVIYIGYAFTDGVLKSDSPIPKSVDPNLIKEQFGIDFQRVEEKGTFSFKSFYKVIPAAERWRKEVSGTGGAYSINYGKGYLYILATTLDSYYEYAGNRSAIEIGDAIVNAYWNYGYGMGEREIDGNGTFLIFTRKIDAAKYLQGKAYGRIIVYAEREENGLKSNSTIVRSVKIQEKKKSDLFHSEEYIPYSLTGNPLDLTYVLNEGEGLTYIYLNIIDSNGRNISKKLISPEPVPKTLSRGIYKFYDNLKSGEYILRIESDTGDVFAQSYLNVARFDVKLIYPAWDIGNFKFEIYYKGEKYQGKLSGITILLDGKENKTLTIEGGSFDYNVTPPIAVGKHLFDITIGSDEIEIPIEYVRAPSVFERPENIILFLLGVMFFAIAFFVKPTEIIYYNVDVPDFPPLKTISVVLKKEEVIELFDKINRDFRWKNVPLTVQDLKGGFMKIPYKGRPLIVSDYNIEKIMDKLIDEGYVKKSIDYYGLARWEKESSCSIYKLAVMRALRDKFVVEGITFTPFGENPNYDTSVSYLGEKIFIHIYESPEVINKAILTAQEGRTIIVFENEEKMREFISNIHSDSETNILFKMLLDDPNGNIDVSPLKEVINVIKKRYTFFYY